MIALHSAYHPFSPLFLCWTHLSLNFVLFRSFLAVTLGETPIVPLVTHSIIWLVSEDLDGGLLIHKLNYLAI